MKILIISDGPHVASGYGKITKYLGRELVSHGFSVDYAAFSHRGEPLNYYYGKQSNPRSKIYSAHVPYRGCSTIIDRSIAESKPDTTIFIRDAAGLSTSRFEGGISLSAYKDKIYRISYVPVMYNSMVPDVVDSTLDSSDLIVPYTDYSRTILMENGIPYNIIAQTIPPGYDGSVFTPGKVDYFGEKVDIFGFIGLINNTRKSLQVLFKAFSQYVQEFAPTALLYIHYAQQSAYEIGTLQQIYGLKGHLMFPSSYTFDWGMPESEMAEIYRSLTACVSASGAEGFNMPFLESMACGTPVVGADTPFYDWSDQILKARAMEAIESPLSLSYAVDTRSFAEKMHEAKTHHIDTEKLKHMEWKEVGKKWITLLDKQ